MLIFERLLVVKLKGKPIMAQNTEEEIEIFYCTQDNAKAQFKSQEIIFA